MFEKDRILYQPKCNVAYLHNPKVACSTIKNSLLFGQVENVHAQFLFPPYNNPKAPIFSVVRNPYRRAISAYLDKIGKGKDFYVWYPFCDKYGISRDSSPTFIEFLTLIDSTNNQETIDHHFRPQHLNLLHEHIVPSFIGYIEDMASVESYLADFGVALRQRTPHKTKSASMADELLDAKAVNLIRKIYEKDFDYYGYSFDVNADFNCEPIIKKQYVSEELIFAHNPLDLSECVELFRDSAIALEDKDIDLAYSLMSLAKTLRPTGPLIEQKIESYEGKRRK